jgi:zinc transport system substrate-binding protein
VAVPELLLQGQTSEHQASFNPRQISAMAEADGVFFMGAGLEVKLAELSGSEAVNGKQFVAVGDAPGVLHLPIREGGAWAGHDHQEEEHAEGEVHGTASHDPHVWLDPENGRAMVRAIAAELSRIDPENGAHYRANAAATDARLVALTQQITAQLAGVKSRPFVVFHDAFQYFEQRFGLAGVGSIADFAATAPSAQRLSAVRQRVAETGAACVFHEPQYSDRAALVVAEGSTARSGVLDPLGATLTPGPGAYDLVLTAIAQNLRACLSGA